MTTRRLTTTTEPVTVAEIKTLLPVDGTEFDARIALAIPALRMEAEQLLQRSLASSTWRLELDAFCCREIKLLWPVVTAVTSVKYLDGNGVEQTLATNAYVVDIHSEPARVYPAANTQWPATYNPSYSHPGAVKIEYSAGYGAAAPEAIKLWIAARIRADIDGCAEETARKLLNGMLDHLKVYA